VPSGVWSDDYEAAVPVSYGERDLQEIDDYVPERRGGFNLIIGTLNTHREYSDVLIWVENVFKMKKNKLLVQSLVYTYQKVVK